MTEISCKDDRSGTSLGVPGVVNFVGGILGENQLFLKVLDYDLPLFFRRTWSRAQKCLDSNTKKVPCTRVVSLFRTNWSHFCDLTKNRFCSSTISLLVYVLPKRKKPQNIKTKSSNNVFKMTVFHLVQSVQQCLCNDCVSFGAKTYVSFRS